MADTKRQLFIIYGVSERADGAIYGKPQIGTIDEYCEAINKANDATDGEWRVCKLGEIWVTQEID